MYHLQKLLLIEMSGENVAVSLSHTWVHHTMHTPDMMKWKKLNNMVFNQCVKFSVGLCKTQLIPTN